MDPQQDINDNAASTESEVSYASYEAQEPEFERASEIDDLPAIKNWMPAPLFSALGAVTSVLGVNILVLLIGDVPTIVIQTILVIVCSVALYRSYFTEKPVLTSSKTISFLNLALAGVVFGLLFNYNLRRSKLLGRPEKGVSYIVAIILFLAITGFYAYLYYFSPNAWLYQNATYDSNTNSYRLNTTGTNTGLELKHDADSSRFVDEDFGVSFILPDGWHQEEFSKERTYLRFKAYPDGSKYVGITYAAQEDPSLSAYPITADDFVGYISEYLDNNKDEKIESIELGGVGYWKVSGSGMYTANGSSIPAYMVVLMYVRNDVMYMFQYMSAIEIYTEDSSYYHDFESMVASATYE